MRCPFCREDSDRVIDSRPIEDGTGVRRRRECSHCSRRYTTYEFLEPNLLMVVKRDGSRQTFAREKLLRGISIACEKRPVSAQQIERIVDSVETEVRERHQAEISSGELGELIMKRLKAIDQVAYIRFASVYRKYQSIEEFISEVRAITPAPEEELSTDNRAE